jgi:hypothetical protein
MQEEYIDMQCYILRKFYFIFALQKLNKKFSVLLAPNCHDEIRSKLSLLKQSFMTDKDINSFET